VAQRHGRLGFGASALGVATIPYKGAGDSLGVRSTPGDACSEWTQGGELSPGQTLLKVGDDMRALRVSGCVSHPEISKFQDVSRKNN
jgi:hypothetical protein